MPTIQPIDAGEFRRVMGHFCSGVTVVAAPGDGAPVGMTCQSFISLSLDPPLIAFAPARTSQSYPAIRRAGRFCVNVLSEAQGALCNAFAQKGADKWRGVRWRPAPSGSPIIEGSLAWIDCRLEAEHDAGDHVLAVGRVLALDASPQQPLCYFRGALSPGLGRGVSEVA